MPSVKIRIQQPTVSDYMIAERATTRVCSESGCERAAICVKGHYMVESRQVRVWVCKAHAVMNPLQLLPTPPSIVAGLEAEAEHVRQMELFYYHNGDTDTDNGVSVKMIAGTGHGNPIPGDRVKSWRWSK